MMNCEPPRDRVEQERQQREDARRRERRLRLVEQVQPAGAKLCAHDAEERLAVRARVRVVAVRARASMPRELRVMFGAEPAAERARLLVGEHRVGLGVDLLHLALDALGEPERVFGAKVLARARAPALFRLERRGQAARARQRRIGLDLLRADRARLHGDRERLDAASTCRSRSRPSGTSPAR